jgi:hypothetical protein
MPVPFFLVPAHFKRRLLLRVMGASVWGAMAFALPASSFAQAVSPNQNRNAPAAGQVTVLPESTTKAPSTGTQNLSLPPALTAPA